MKILYITTTIDQNDYKDFVKIWKKHPNPSNQNFHNKLIRALSLTNEVEVLSIRPFSSKMCTVKRLEKENKEIDGIKWHYLTCKANKLLRISTIIKEYKTFSKQNELKDYVVLTDTINPSCLKASTYIAKKHKLPLIGICTDSPSNITGTSRSYTLYLLTKAKKCNGFIALTNELKELYIDEDKKPSLVFEGIVEDTKDIKPYKGDKPYFYFGGSLLPRYGVFDLINAFKKIDNKDVDLYIAGHTGNMSQLQKEIKENENIKYLGTIDVRDVLSYEKGAIANINPRPYSQDLDRFSIPSKTIEYLSSGRVVISVKNTKLQKIFDKEIIWINSSNEQDLLEAMNKVLLMDEKERKNLGEDALTKVMSVYSFKEINKKITHFLTNF